MSCVATTKKSPAYKKLLKKLGTLQGQAGKAAFVRAELVVKIYNDPEFQQDYDEFQRLEILNGYVKDLCLKFKDLELLIQHYPKEHEWTDGDLQGMLEKIEERKRREAKKAAAMNRIPAKKSRNTTNLAERKVLIADRDRWKDAARKSQKEMEQLVKVAEEKETLQQENARLRKENAQLKGQLSEAKLRIAELERQLKFRLAA